MDIYSLVAYGNNDGEYEDYRHFYKFHGVFSTIEKAKEYAEKLMEQTRKGTGSADQSYDETFGVIIDWYECKGDIFKEIAYGEGYADEWIVTYHISKVTVDSEFKEDK